MIKTYYLAKVLSKLHLSSYKECNIHDLSKVDSHCVLAYTEIDKYSYVGSKTQITGTKIGKFCSIGSNCQIGGGVHPLTMVSTSPVFLRGKNILRKNFSEIEYDSYKEVNIGNDVWIGDGSYIKSGVKICDGAIIGAHSVVTRNVGPYEIVAGSPARVIRKRFEESEIVALMELCWWNWSDEKIMELGTYFETPKMLFDKCLEKEK